MTAKIKLNARDVLLAAKEAYSKGELQAQSGKKPDKCEYRDRAGSCCAIGVGMSEEQIAIIMKTRLTFDGERMAANHTGLTSLVEKGVVEVEGGFEKLLYNVQAAHDACLGEPTYNRDAKIKTLGRTINKSLADYDRLAKLDQVAA